MTTRSVLGLITARAGSQGLRNKNVAPLAGKPLLQWTIDAALAATSLERLVLSTDSQEYADLARTSGVHVPFLRPDDLARHDVPAIEAVIHAIVWLAEHEGHRPDYVMVLAPTSPLRTAGDIDASVELGYDHDADSVLSVSETRDHPYWTYRLLSDGRLEDFVAKPDGSLRRQAIPPAYVVNGAIYLTRRDVLLTEHTFVPPGTYAYVMPPERSVDIDSASDLERAAALLARERDAVAATRGRQESR